MTAASPGAPDFDALEDDDDVPRAAKRDCAAAPGPVLSPNDPRYGRQAAPVYSECAADRPDHVAR